MFVKIPLGRRTVRDPVHQREEQMDQALRAAGAGLVLGWGDSLGAPRADGTRLAAFMRIDISASPPLENARALLRDLLPALEVPLGTEIHFPQGGSRAMDLLTDAGWQTDLPPPATA